MISNNKYYNQSLSPLDYVKNNLQGVMRSVNW
ncbi:Uncharacterised protein, partial [Mycoplasmopsis synoviae]